MGGRESRREDHQSVLTRRFRRKLLTLSGARVIDHAFDAQRAEQGLRPAAADPGAKDGRRSREGGPE
jgi:hypothetical protein